MSNKYALYLTDSSMIFATVDACGVQPIFSRSLENDSCIDELKQLLKKLQPEIIKVFVDVVGEEFKHESVPHIGSKDRELLLARKMKTLFPLAELTWKKHLRREKTGRKDDVYLLAGVPLQGATKAVLDALIQVQQKVSGIYSISILEQLVKKSIPVGKQHLVVSRVLNSKQEKKSYRQTFYKNNELVISRVTSVSTKSDTELYQQMLSEIGRMHQFLNVTRQLDQGEPLQVVTILSETEVQGLQQCAADSEFEFSYMDLAKLVSENGLKKSTEIPASLAELLVYLTFDKKEKAHFYPENLCASNKHWVIKKRLTVTSAMAVALSLVLAVGVWLMANEQSKSLQVLQTEVQQLKAHKNQLENQVLETELPPRQMNQVVELYNKISENRNAPEDILPVIARAYQGFNDISIDRFSWVAAQSARQQDKNISLINRLEKPKKYQLGLSFPVNLSNRATLNRLEAFSDALMSQAEISEVLIEESAIDTRVTGQMAESMGKDSKRVRDTRFTLLITM